MDRIYSVLCYRLTNDAANYFIRYSIDISVDNQEADLSESFQEQLLQPVDGPCLLRRAIRIGSPDMGQMASLKTFRHWTQQDGYMAVDHTEMRMERW